MVRQRRYAQRVASSSRLGVERATEGMEAALTFWLRWPFWALLVLALLLTPVRLASLQFEIKQVDLARCSLQPPACDRLRQSK